MDYDHLFKITAAQNVGTPQQSNHNMMTQFRSEIVEVFKIFNEKQPKVIAEIGIAQGGTLAAWCMMAPSDALIVAIDRDPNDCLPRPGELVHPEVYSGPVTGMTEHGGGAWYLRKKNQDLRIVRGWTYEDKAKRQFEEHLGGRKIEFLMHDCSHSANMARDDFNWLWPLVADGGIFVSHDICSSDDPNCNKREWWLDVKANCKYQKVMEFIDSPDQKGFGLGVLVK